MKQHPGQYLWIPADDPSMFWRNPAYKEYILSNEATDQRALLAKGYYQYLDKDYPAARETLKRAAEARMADGDTPSLTYLVYFTLGKVHYELENRSVTRVIAVKEEGILVEKVLSDRPFDDTIAAYKKAAEANRDFAPAYQNLAFYLNQNKQYPEALVYAEFLLRLVPRCSWAFSLRGMTYANLGRYEAALTDFETALELRPTDFSAAYNLGRIYAILKRHGEAVRQFETTVTLAERSLLEWMALDALGTEEMKLGDVRRAITASQKAVRVLQELKESQKDDNPFVDPSMETMIQRQRQRIAECRRRLGQE